MAKLLSEDDQVKSAFNLVILKEQMKSKVSISWVPYKLTLKSADKELVYEMTDGEKGAGDYVLALEPVNELSNLIGGIKNFLESKTTNLFSFEPIEPSFELIIERSHKGYSVTCWVDAGNVMSDHFSWDGFGIRFFTGEKRILSFVEELIKENEDLMLKDNA